MTIVSLPFAAAVPPRRWKLRGRFPDGELAEAPYPPLIRHLLWHRGVRTAAEARAMLEGAPVEHDPLLLPDIDRALARLRRAIAGGELIAVYGDFDVDGVTASAILIEGLEVLGGRALSYIPDRFSEGYGVNSHAIELLRSQGVTLILTADCGTSSLAEVALAGKLGVDVIVLDHHVVGPELPPAVAVVNPKRADNRYPDPELASGALSYKLMAALYGAMGRAFERPRYLDLVALSTVCDVAPLLNENRSLVREGLAALSRTARPGLIALMEAAAIDPGGVDTEAISFALGPRLNAAGRLAHGRMALELLLERDEARATERALELSALNQERQQATADAVDLARSLLAAEDPSGEGPLIFVGHEEIPPGIVGLVAARLAEQYHRPAVVYERGESTSRASCRSIREFDITAALRQCGDLMLRFGGHRAAAGFTAANEKLPALKAELTRIAGEALAGVEPAPALTIDADVPLHRVNGRLIELILKLAPFGNGNPEPVFLSRGIEVLDVRAMGVDGEHLRLKLRDGRLTWPAVAFRQGGERTPPFARGDRVDVVYSFGCDRGSSGGLELRVRDLRPSAVG